VDWSRKWSEGGTSPEDEGEERYLYNYKYLVIFIYLELCSTFSSDVLDFNVEVEDLGSLDEDRQPWPRVGRPYMAAACSREHYSGNRQYQRHWRPTHQPAVPATLDTNAPASSTSDTGYKHTSQQYQRHWIQTHQPAVPAALDTDTPASSTSDTGDKRTSQQYQRRGHRRVGYANV
jgi:hypothetical protein